MTHTTNSFRIQEGFVLKITLRRLKAVRMVALLETAFSWRSFSVIITKMEVAENEATRTFGMEQEESEGLSTK